jgi:hypothetical protein
LGNQEERGGAEMKDVYEFEDNLEFSLLAKLFRSKLLFNKYHDLIKEEYWESDPRRDIYHIISELYEKFQEPPTQEALRNEVYKLLKPRIEKFKPDSLEANNLRDKYNEDLDKIFSVDLTAVSEGYLAHEVIDFAQRQESKKLLIDTAGKLRSGKPVLTVEELKQDLSCIQKIGNEAEVKESKIIFPKNAIQGFIKNFADLYSSHLETPYEFWIFNCVTCLGHIFIRVQLNSQLPTEPRFYTICIGRSGSTRKSEGRRQTVNFFGDWILKVEEPPLLNEKKNELPSQYFNTCYGTGSAEGLMTALRRSPCLLLCYDELRGFTQKCDVKGSNLLQIVNILFEETFAENVTKDNFSKVTDCHLSLLACTTQETWDQIFTPNFLAIGFINRLWLVPGEGVVKDADPERVPQREKYALFMQLNKLIESFPPGTVIEKNQEARDLEQEYYKILRNHESESESCVRLDGYLRRLQLIMAISEGKREIDRDLMERCIALIDWQMEIRKMFQPQEYTDLMSRIEGLLRKRIKRYPGIHHGQLMNKIKAKTFDSFKIGKAIESLQKSGEIKVYGNQYWATDKIRLE